MEKLELQMKLSPKFLIKVNPKISKSQKCMYLWEFLMKARGVSKFWILLVLTFLALPLHRSLKMDTLCCWQATIYYDENVNLFWLTLRRPFRQSWQLGVFFSAYGWALAASPKRWKIYPWNRVLPIFWNCSFLCKTPVQLTKRVWKF